MFTTPIQIIELELDIDALTEFCYEIKRKDLEGTEKSNIGGWQSDNIFNETHKKFSKLKTKIEEAANIYHQWIGFNSAAVQKLDNIWANINQKGSANMAHAHPQAIFSGAFYLYANSPIVFQHPYKDISVFYWTKKLVENDNEFNSGECSICPTPNTLLLFPAWIYHRVVINKEDKDRISLSFNTSTKMKI